jgi:hypothetical protein
MLVCGKLLELKYTDGQTALGIPQDYSGEGGSCEILTCNRVPIHKTKRYNACEKCVKALERAS